jgi:hypothetical protein
MGVLRPLAAAALLAPAACYEPQLADCAVACSSSSDCAPGQTCGAAGYCAAPDLACAPRGGVDAPRPVDARPADAPSMKVLLHVRADRGGAVIVQGTETCDADCWFSVPGGAPVLLHAVPRAGHRFDRWTTPACGTQDESCILTPIEPSTEVRARFERDDDDDDHDHDHDHDHDDE